MLLYVDCVLSRKRKATGVAGTSGVRQPHSVAMAPKLMTGGGGGFGFRRGISSARVGFRGRGEKGTREESRGFL
jgi:hypothetical protein